MATLQSLQSKIAKLQAQAEAIVRKQSSAVIGQIHKLMEDHGLTVADLQGAANKLGHAKGSSLSADGKSKATEAKYQDPKSGATWSGRGRVPGWIANAKDRSKFLIDGSTTAPQKAENETGAPKGNYVRGPQPAKYRDPKTGAEWSGRGKAPSWLAGARDRSKFLIDGSLGSVSESKAASKKAASERISVPNSSEAVTEPKASTRPSAKKVTAKKVAAKKVATKKVSAKKAATRKTAGAKKGPKSQATKKVASKKITGKKAASQTEEVSKASPDGAVTSAETPEVQLSA